MRIADLFDLEISKGPSFLFVSATASAPIPGGQGRDTSASSGSRSEGASVAIRGLPIDLKSTLWHKFRFAARFGTNGEVCRSGCCRNEVLRRYLAYNTSRCGTTCNHDESAAYNQLIRGLVDRQSSKCFPIHRPQIQDAPAIHKQENKTVYVERLSQVSSSTDMKPKTTFAIFRCNLSIRDDCPIISRNRSFY